MSDPYRGDVWLVDLNPVRGHEQKDARPALVISTDQFNTGPSGLVVIVPITTKNRKLPLHVEIKPPEGGLTSTSYIMCDQIRTVDKEERLLTRWDSVKPQTINEVENRIRLLLDI